MGLLDGIRQWTSERFDDMFGQSNEYHMSSGKTQEEYEKDLENMEGLEWALKGSTMAGGTTLGAILGGPLGGVFGAGLTAGLLAGEDSTYGSGYGTKDKSKSSSSKSSSNSSKSNDDSKDDKEEGGNSSSDSSSKDYDVDEMAGEFILGAWGNGQDRIDNMINAGYSLDDYNKIQTRVNEAYDSGRDLHEWTNKANEKLHYW